MNKTVWIWNHYAGNMFLTGGGRHYYLAKHLKQNGFEPVVFCSNYDHFSHGNCVETDALWKEETEPETGVPYVFVRTRAYSGNGKQRVLNMVDFYRNVRKAAKQYAAEHGAPGVVYASSVHPLTLVAGIGTAKRFGVKCVSEVRDLWPESIVAYSTKWTRKSPLMRVLYAGEKWIYKKSDVVIMTWPGGYDYICEQGWQKTVPASKVVHISNGVELEEFRANERDHPCEDADLSRGGVKNFVYTGSVRQVNNLGLLVDAAELLKTRGNETARILVFGDGDELDRLRAETRDRGLDNLVFKGRVPKQCVPSVLSQSYAAILHNSSTSLDKYGQSQNKFFEYLAAGRPILMTYSVGHSVIKENACGIELDRQTPEAVAEAVEKLCALDLPQYRAYCEHAAACAEAFDYGNLCRKLTDVLRRCTDDQ